MARPSPRFWGLKNERQEAKQGATQPKVFAEIIDTDKGIDVYATKDGQPLAKVNVSLYDEEGSLKGKGETDEAGKVSFEAMLDKLFDGVQKFRIGNPILGMDDECLYGKSFDDETAIPITSKLYRLVMNAGAQHLNYVKNGKVAGAVFIYEKGLIEAFAKDENGNPVSLKTDGIDFSNLSKGQSLLTNLRQTVFHEWTHNSEEEVIDSEKASIDYEYKTEEGKIYRNYEKIHNYVTYKNKGNLQEPRYIISTQKDFNGNRKKYFQAERGKLRLIKEINFELVKKKGKDAEGKYDLDFLKDFH